MNEHNWFDWVVGAVMAVAGYILKQLWTKAEASVSRAELQAALDRFSEESAERHRENKGTLQRIDARVDQLYQQRIER